MSQATQYEQDYSELSADITAKIGRIPSLFGKDKHDMVGEVEGLLEEAKDLIDQIEVESHAATGDVRKQVSNFGITFLARFCSESRCPILKVNTICCYRLFGIWYIFTATYRFNLTLHLANLFLT